MSELDWVKKMLDLNSRLRELMYNLITTGDSVVIHGSPTARFWQPNGEIMQFNYNHTGCVTPLSPYFDWDTGLSVKISKILTFAFKKEIPYIFYTCKVNSARLDMYISDGVRKILKDLDIKDLDIFINIDEYLEDLFVLDIKNTVSGDFRKYLDDKYLNQYKVYSRPGPYCGYDDRYTAWYKIPYNKNTPVYENFPISFSDNVDKVFKSYLNAYINFNFPDPNDKPDPNPNPNPKPTPPTNLDNIYVIFALIILVFIALYYVIINILN